MKRMAGALFLVLSTTSCAAMFRESKTNVVVESSPAGAEVTVKNAHAVKTPAEVTVTRSGLTQVTVVQPGFYEHRGVVRKSTNGAWLVVDLSTCVVPVLLCVPLIVDAVTGAWTDVQDRYQARLVPIVASPGEYPTALLPAPTRITPTPTTTTSPESTLSDSERKAAARAAYQEGVELQAQKSFANAIERFQAAQRLFDAPPHLVHLAQCFAATGKLVEAYETYETLAHQGPRLGPDSPPQYREAIALGKKENAELLPRIPSLSIRVEPSPAGLRTLVVLVNGRAMPNELIGISRHVNPGSYEITATAWGIAAAKPVRFDLAEGEQHVADVKLGN